METQIKSLLNIDAIVSNPDVDGELRHIAKTLMDEYCIFNGEYIYRPIEIEFYIYDTIEHPDTHVYPRDRKEAGELFFHLSGMDICFKSSLEEGRFGGILIRALEREKNGERTLFGGPLVCKDEVLNTATEKCSVKSCENKHISKEPHTSPRQGINENNSKKIEDKFWNIEYRFIRGDMDIEKPIERYVDTFDFSQKAPKVPKPKRTYSLKYQLPKNK